MLKTIQFQNILYLKIRVANLKRIKLIIIEFCLNLYNQFNFHGLYPLKYNFKFFNL